MAVGIACVVQQTDRSCLHVNNKFNNLFRLVVGIPIFNPSIVELSVVLSIQRFAGAGEYQPRLPGVIS